jgi:hypothetical protein
VKFYSWSKYENFIRRLLIRLLGFDYARLASIYYEDSPSRVEYAICEKVSETSFLSIQHVLTGEKKSHAFQERFLVDYSNVIVDSDPGVLLNSRGQIIKESSSWPGDRLLYAWPSPRRQKISKFKTYTESLFMPSYGFYHWLIEDLPTFLQCASYFPDRSVLVNKNAPKYIHDFLESIPNKIEYTEKFFVAKKIASVTRGDDVGWPLKSDISVLLEFFDAERKSVEGRKLYISRKNSSRSPTNEKNVEEMLQGRGFEIVHTENLHLREAIGLISTADVLMGPHGAGLSGQVWMKSGSRCIDLAASSYWTEDIYRLSAILNHKYIPFIYGIETQNEVNIENLVDFLVLNGL